MAARLEGSHHQVVRRVVMAVTLTLPTPGDETGLSSCLSDRGPSSTAAHHDGGDQRRGGQDDDDAADWAGEPGRQDRHADGRVDGGPGDRPGGRGRHVAAQRHAGHSRGELDDALDADGQEGHRHCQHAPARRPRLGPGIHGGLEQRDPLGARGPRRDAPADPVHGVRTHHGQAPEEQEDPGVGQGVDPFQHARKANL